MKCSIIPSDIFNNITETQMVLQKNNIESNSDNNFNNNTTMNIISNNENIENGLSDNSEYKQINLTLRNLHNIRKLSKNYLEDQNNVEINNKNNNNNIPISNNFYFKINSQLKNLHISNIKQHKKDYLN